MRLPRSADGGDQSRTYDPPARLLWARALVELCRIVPVLCSAALAVLTVAALLARLGALVALLAGLVLLAAGVLACLRVHRRQVAAGGPAPRPVSTRCGAASCGATSWRTPSSRCWPCRGWPGAVPGTPRDDAWLRGLGAQIGRGVWCESYWLPEADLVTLGDGVTVNRGCVLQTHLFHDRIMRTDTVVLREGATLGPGGIVLPGATVGARTTLGPASLVMRGGVRSRDTRWLGNPIEAWRS